MFSTLSEKLKKIIHSFSDKRLTEESVNEAARKVRYALLDADVNYQVASSFMKRVKEKALGQELIKSVKPTEQFIKIVHDELAQLMGAEESSLHLKGTPAVIMLMGLQGSGKTTTAAKLSRYLLKQGKKILIAACDLQRPAAIDQLKVLGNQIGVDVFTLPDEKKALTVAKKAYKEAVSNQVDVLIVDTAGRLHIDKELMQELASVKKELSPCESLFVANATSGQDAVKVAQEFDTQIGITGSILTMLDGDARAGAALSIREVTGKPLKFEGVGERVEDFQLFHPTSMADRILDMGDIINLVRKAEEHVDNEEKQDLEKKMRKANFTFNDYLKQLSMVKKMGSVKGILKMIPGASQLGNLDMSDQHLNEMKVMIESMRPEEREEKKEFDISRRRRVAKGSGLSLDTVNKLVKGFKRTKTMMKKLSKQKNFSDIKQLRDMSWRQ